ncbi:unnamed protein product, partial [Prorocentrum cordatum]
MVGRNRRGSADAVPDQLLSWLEQEVRGRLLHIDQKLDEVLVHARGHGGPPPRRPSAGSARVAKPMRTAVLSPVGLAAPDPSLPAGRGGTVWRQLGQSEEADSDDSPPTSARAATAPARPSAEAEPTTSPTAASSQAARKFELRLPPLFLGARADQPPEVLPGDVMPVNTSAVSSARAAGARPVLPALPALSGLQQPPDDLPPALSSGSSSEGAERAEVRPTRPVPPVLREVGEIMTMSTSSSPEAKKQVSWRRPGSGGLESPSSQTSPTQVLPAQGDTE